MRFRTILFTLSFAVTALSLRAELVISEFLARNDSGLADEDGEFSDWVEIWNSGEVELDLGGYGLSDDPARPMRWTFPTGATVSGGGYLVVFASDKDRLGSELHTDFKLDGDGGYVGLTDSVGTVVSSFFFAEQDEDVSLGKESSSVFTYAVPTPGAVNAGGVSAGPAIDDVSGEPAQPFAGALTVALSARAMNGEISAVRVFYRVDFEAELELPASDSGGGIYEAVIPATAFAPNVMTRWRFEVEDSGGRVSKSPAFKEAENSPEYFGTVGFDENLETNLTTLQWFIEDPAGANLRFPTGERGVRGALYYLGEFYDNVGFKLHGQSSSTFPKKSYNVDFNKGDRFEWHPDAPKLADVNLMTNWADKSKVRHALAYEVMREAGVATHFAYPIRVHQNGEFFSVADLIEDGDDRYLERVGLNPEGALYKAYDMTLNKDTGASANEGMQKKNRQDEDNSDLQALIDGLDLEGEALENYLFDHIDLPSTINYLASLPGIRMTDVQRKNWYLYRDSGKSDEWALLPWDLDLSFGREFSQVDKYFDNALLPNERVFVGGTIRLASFVQTHPRLRPMFLRRVRSLCDQFLNESSTPLAERYLERRLDEMAAVLDDPALTKSDAQWDFETWGSWLDGQGGAQVPATLNHPDVETMAEAIARFKTEFISGRRVEIYENNTVGNGGVIPGPQKEEPGGSLRLVDGESSARFLIPVDDSAGTSWRDGGFDDSLWSLGSAAIGYDLGSGYDGEILTDVQSTMWIKNASIYLRIPFEVVDWESIESLALEMQYDDGFIVYLNGVPILEENAPASPEFDSTSDGAHEASAGSFELFEAPGALAALQDGANVLAIHGFNQSKSNDDFLLVPRLTATLENEGGLVNPQLVIEEVEASPDSGDQDEEFILISNPNEKAVDISDWSLSGAVAHRFKGGTVIPAGTSLYVSPKASSFRARATSPRGGEGLFVQGGYTGHLSNRGETITLQDEGGALNASFTYSGSLSEAQLFLIISEVMYHPEPDGEAEFIELLNTSDSVTLDLTGIRFTSAIEFDFTASSVTSLGPGERVLVVKNVGSFEAAYGIGLPVAGVFLNDSKLSNGGETVKLEDAQNNTIAEFRYDDEGAWPLAADDGYSLVYIAGDPDDSESWRISVGLGGTPGGNDSIGLPVSGDLLSYALGADGVLTMNGETLSFPRVIGADQVDLRVERSADMTSWEAASDLNVLSEAPLGDGRMIVTIGGPTLTSETKHFYRLFISHPINL